SSLFKAASSRAFAPPSSNIVNSALYLKGLFNNVTTQGKARFATASTDADPFCCGMGAIIHFSRLT
ncbi:MAG: hypothetical protein NZ936_17935, partial [Alphaproteobacteria bacterium]|nr:hypothetical protein [Alphaproteobacteria bacterium]